MTKRNKNNKKFELSRETVRRMSNGELRRVAGGGEESPIDAKPSQWECTFSLYCGGTVEAA